MRRISSRWLSLAYLALFLSLISSAGCTSSSRGDIVEQDDAWFRIRTTLVRPADLMADSDGAGSAQRPLVVTHDPHMSSIESTVASFCERHGGCDVRSRRRLMSSMAEQMREMGARARTELRQVIGDMAKPG